MSAKFIRIDCDNVGDKIENLLYKNKPEEAQRVSDVIKLNIKWFIGQVVEDFNAEILLLGSDDILFTVDERSYSLESLEHLRAEFYNRSEISISIGIGNDIRESLVNLHIAKISGKNKIIK